MVNYTFLIVMSLLTNDAMLYKAFIKQLFIVKVPLMLTILHIWSL